MTFFPKMAVLLIGLSCGANSSGGQAGGILRVFVHFEAEQDIVARAEADASHIFAGAGVQLIWENCGFSESCGAESDTRKPVLVILRETGKDGLGYSLVSQSGGNRSVLGMRNIERLSNSSRIAEAQILGAAMAHELGHLLLGPAHTKTGLMRGNWDVRDLCRLEQRALKFDSAQCARIRRAALARARDDQMSLADRTRGSSS